MSDEDDDDVGPMAATLTMHYVQQWGRRGFLYIRSLASQPKPKRARPNQEPRPDYDDRQWARDLRHKDIADETKPAGKAHRRGFCVPYMYKFFNELVGMCIDRGWFPEQAADAL